LARNGVIGRPRSCLGGVKIRLMRTLKRLGSVV
jgi:hypothetical protein